MQEKFRETFSPLAQDRKKSLTTHQLTPVYGYAAALVHELSATPIAASLLVSQMFGEPPYFHAILAGGVTRALLQRALVKGNNS